MKEPRIAIVHDWLTGMRGGEKCLEAFCELFPNATLFTLVHDKGSVSAAIENMDIRTSFLNGIPGISRHYRGFLPFFPLAIESFNLAGYDIVLSSSHCVAKGARSAPGALHVCYCYTPVRYAWSSFHEYFSDEAPLKRWFISRAMEGIRKWDISSNKRIDYFVAISDNVKNRIREFYKREADVIYPPADVAPYAGSEACDKGYYLIVSALVPYKRVDIAIRAFNGTERRLVVIGKGTDAGKLKRIADTNIDFLGWVDNERLKEHYARCRALIFPGLEDFGIVPVEAQAQGKAVIAYAAGGVLETVIPFEKEGAAAGRATGVFFREQTPDALNEAIETFENNKQAFDPASIRENALRFNGDRFKHEIRDYIKDKWERHLNVGQ